MVEIVKTKLMNATTLEDANAQPGASVTKCKLNGHTQQRFMN